MKITICAGCGEAKEIFATNYPQQAICHDCATVYNIKHAKICTMCKKQPAVYEPEQQPLHTAQRIYICEDCADKWNIDIEKGWCELSKY